MRPMATRLRLAGISGGDPDEDDDEMLEARMGKALGRALKLLGRALRLEKKVGGGPKLQPIDAKGRYAHDLTTTLQRELYKCGRDYECHRSLEHVGGLDRSCPR